MNKAIVFIHHDTWHVRFDNGKPLPLPVKADEMDFCSIKSFVNKNLGSFLNVVNGMNEVDTKLNELRVHQIYYFGFAMTNRKQMQEYLKTKVLTKQNGGDL